MIKIKVLIDFEGYGLKQATIATQLALTSIMRMKARGDIPKALDSRGQDVRVSDLRQYSLALRV
jgi:hypothetical protein